jgi:hypothetical protein
MLIGLRKSSRRSKKSRASSLLTGIYRASLEIAGAMIIRADKFAGPNLPLGLLIGCVANGGACLVYAIKTALLALTLIAALRT